MFAFWRYDRFPNVLGGIIEEIKNEGKVTIKGGYTGMLFKPIIILNDDEGIEIKKQLDDLEKEYTREKEQLAKIYKDKAFKIAPFLK